MPSVDPIAQVQAANRAFYEAFEARDLDAMSAVWERSDRASCTHPGWGTLRGWAAVAASFFTLFAGPAAIQFVLTREHVIIEGDVAWVTVDENLLGDQAGATVAAVNLFVRDERGSWSMVAHHGSAVIAEPPVERPAGP